MPIEYETKMQFGTIIHLFRCPEKFHILLFVTYLIIARNTFICKYNTKNSKAKKLREIKRKNGDFGMCVNLEQQNNFLCFGNDLDFLKTDNRKTADINHQQQETEKPQMDYL